MHKTEKTSIVLVRKDGTTALSWGPASGSRPPFRKGNMAALKHGAYSPRIVGEVAITGGGSC
jgi:hypothetical protein